MTSLTKSLAAALLASTAIAASAAPPNILFSTGNLPDGTRLRPGAPPSGTINVRGGVTQVENDDGEVFSFVGDAVFNASGPDVSITDGRVTVTGGRDGAAAFSVGGNIATSVNGQNATASFNVNAGAIAAGRVLGGSVTVTAGGVTRNFDLGQAFAAALGAAPRPVSTAGAAPITALATAEVQAAPQPEVTDIGGNPFVAPYPGGSQLALIEAAFARRRASDGFSLPISDALFSANIASVRYGENLGTLSGLVA